MTIAKRLEAHTPQATLPAMRPARGVLILGAVLLGGCGATERDQVQAKLQQFAVATAGGDTKTLCTQVLAPSLLERLASLGLGCDSAMRIFVASVRDPALTVSRITIAGASASAITLSTARGQQPTLEQIELVKTGQGWRLSSLGSGAPAGAR